MISTKHFMLYYYMKYNNRLLPSDPAMQYENMKISAGSGVINETQMERSISITLD